MLTPENWAKLIGTAPFTLGARMRYKRESLGLSQEELAKRAKTTQGCIHKIECGKILRPRNIVQIAEALGVTPEWLVFGVENSVSLSLDELTVARASKLLSPTMRKAMKTEIQQRLAKAD